MTHKTKFKNDAKQTLYQHLNKLNPSQFKIFYGVFVHYWVKHKCFISKQNLFNLRCELNQLCHELDESFPDQYEDHKLIKSFFLVHPYYYMDVLPINLIAKLFAEHVDNHIDILSNIAKTISETDIHTTYAYANDALGLNEPVEKIASEALGHINSFS